MEMWMHGGEFYAAIGSNTQEVPIATWINLRKVRKVGNSKIYSTGPCV